MSRAGSRAYVLSCFIAKKPFTFISNNCQSQLFFTFSTSNKRQHMVKNMFRFYPCPYQKMLQHLTVVSPHCLLQSIIIISCKFPVCELPIYCWHNHCLLYYLTSVQPHDCINYFFFTLLNTQFYTTHKNDWERYKRYWLMSIGTSQEDRYIDLFIQN